MVEEVQPEFRLEDLTLMDSPGYPFETVCDSAHENQVVMGPQMVWATPIAQDIYEVFMQSNRGLNQAMLTVSPGKPGVVLWVPSGGVNFNGPAGGIYAELACDLQAAGMSSLRMGYREQGSFQECVLDTLAWLSFLQGTGAKTVVLAGHVLGAAVAIATAVLHPLAKAVVAISPRQQDTEMVHNLGPKPLLVIHGEKDTRIPADVVRDLYGRASQPKELVIYPDAGTDLAESRAELREKLGMWLSEQLGEVNVYLATLEARSGQYPDMTRPVPPDSGGPRRHMVLTRDDMVDMDVEAIVNTTGTWLDLQNTELARTIVERGGSEIQEQLWAQAPVFVGNVAVTGAGKLKAKHVFHAITGGDSAAEPLTRDEAVAMTTRDALAQANSLGLKTIALPAIGTGRRGFPIEKAAQLMVTITAAHLTGETSLEKVTFSIVSDGVYRAFESMLKLLPE